MSARKLTSIKNNINQFNPGKYSAKNIFNTYISVDELKRHPELYPSLKREKKLRLGVLSEKKPKIINIHGLQSETKSKFASKLNSFYKVFFDYYKRQKNSSENTNALNQENKDFLKKYKASNKTREINNNKNKFNELKEEYEKKDYYVPSLNSTKNLFNGNILLSNNNELKNYILYDLGTSISNDKSISFLHKINKKLGDKTSDKALKEIYGRLDMEKYNKDKIENDDNIDIINTQNDIKNVKSTINSIDDIDHFFKLENKKYLITLQEKKTDNTINSDILPLRYNSAFKPSENEKNKNQILLILDKNQKRASKEFLMKNKMKFNKNKKEKLKINLNNIDNKLNKFMKKETKTIDYNTSNSPLEYLYDKMSTKEDLLIYQPEIKNYLENKKYDISVKLNPSNICNNFEKTREKICTSEFLKNNMQLRKQLGNIESKVEEINNNDIKAINNMNNIEDKMIKLFCNIDNPKPKEENDY